MKKNVVGKGLVLGIIVCLLIVTFITISFSSVAIFQIKVIKKEMFVGFTSTSLNR